jgi:molybdenum cofactor cytidylyltransferase
MLPVVDPPTEHPGSASVIGVLLAAGTSSRYGDTNKLLVTVGRDGEPVSRASESGNSTSEPIVRHSAQTLLNAGLDHVLVVVGYESDRIRRALSGLDIGFVENAAYESGHASSVRAGVQALDNTDSVEKPVDAVVFGLGDMPYVDPESVRELVRAYEDGSGSALAAGYRGERGNPVLFDRQHFSALVDHEDDIGGKQVLLSASDGAVVETSDPGVRQDIDEPGDTR